MILVLDLETTGSDDYQDIIELGMVLVDDDLNEIDHYQSVFGSHKLPYMDPIVTEMHAKSGLTEASRGSWVWADDPEVDAGLNEWLNQYHPKTTHIPLSGSGVSHFDRKFIRRDWPNFDKRLTYWALDVGVMRRMFKLAGAPILEVESKNHRALDDAYLHLEELKYYTKKLKGLAVNETVRVG